MKNKTNIFSSIDKFIEQHNLIPDKSTVILGLSGGPDSVFLLYLLAPLHQKKAIQLIVAHLDHEWRSESAQDVIFCRQAAEQFSCPFVTKKMSQLKTSVKFNGSKEEYARKMRRSFLESVAQKHQANAIALGHHLQDQQETFFIRLIRGSGLTGLCAIQPKNGLYIRPLLQTNKQDIINYLDKQAIVYLMDPTNTSENFLRNRIRKHVLPSLEECDDRFSKNFQRTITQLQKTEHFLATLTAETFENVSSLENNVHILNLYAFLSLHPVMRHRVLVYWLCKTGVQFIPTEKFFNEIIRFFNQPGSKDHLLHHSWKLIKQKDHACIKTL